MASSRIVMLMKNSNCLFKKHFTQVRSATSTSTGALLPKPQANPFGIIGVVCAVIPGLLIGAMISKSIANFLEENDLFVPSDDDDDDN